MHEARGRHGEPLHAGSPAPSKRIPNRDFRFRQGRPLLPCDPRELDEDILSGITHGTNRGCGLHRLIVPGSTVMKSTFRSCAGQAMDSGPLAAGRM